MSGEGDARLASSVQRLESAAQAPAADRTIVYYRDPEDERRPADDRAHVAHLWYVARRATQAWTLNGSAEHRYQGNLNLRRERLDSARLIADLRNIALSAGSACASGSGRPSHVLRALGLSDREARSSIRLGFGRYTGEDELASACRRIDEAARAQEGLAG